LREFLDKSFFPYVIKPARYCGGEPGQIVKAHDGRITCLLAVTDRYEHGANNPLTHSHYHFLNTFDSIACERVFAPDRDAEKLLREKQISLFSIESNQSAKEFDCIAFLCLAPLQFPLLPVLLELAGLPIHSADRNDSHPIVVICGPACRNPEPVLDFVDCALVGDSEEPLVLLLETLKKHKASNKSEKLDTISRTIPSARMSHGYEGRSTVPHSPTELSPQLFPAEPVVPLIETFPNRLEIEMGRHTFTGEASTFRARTPAELSLTADSQLKASGYGEASLLPSYSVPHAAFEKSVTAIVPKVEAFGADLALPVLHPAQVSASLLDSVSKVNNSILKISVGAMSDRLRAFLRLDYDESVVMHAVRMAFSKGYLKLRLSAAIGLPGEDDDDLKQLAHCLDAVMRSSREYSGRKTVALSLLPFQPLPHTPFQWDSIATGNELSERTAKLKRLCRHEGLSISLVTADMHEISAALLRGDRALSRLIAVSAREGFRFCDQQEQFDSARWNNWAAQTGVDIAAQNRPLPFSAELPWSSIDCGVSVAALIQKRQTASQIIAVAEAPSGTAHPPLPTAQAPASEFGRSKKKIVSRVLSAPTKNQVRIRWGRTERLRYLAHLDSIRIFERTIRRSQLPVAWSGVERPTMKVSFGPPLPLGFTSECEFVDITLSVNLTASMLDSFRLELPSGLQLHDSRVIFGKPLSLSAALNRAVYLLPLCQSPIPAEEVVNRVEQFMGQSVCEIIRETKSGTSTIDIRAMVHSLVIKDAQLIMTLGIGEGGYVRPSELFGWLLPDHRGQIPALMCHRKELYRQDANGVRVAGIEV
jgi:radical SAM-linked protein